MRTAPFSPGVSIVVVSWNTRELTLSCLKSVAAESSEGFPDCEVILVDNASTDGTSEAVAALPGSIRIIQLSENIGFARAANRAIAESSGRYVLLLNSDAELPKGSLARLVGILDEHPRAAAVGAALVGPGGERQFSCGRFLNPVNQFAEALGISRLLPIAKLQRSYRERELEHDCVEVDWCVGACLLLRRAAIDEVGSFDERFFMYSEDEDLCLRLRLAGWAVLHAPGVAVYHQGGGSASRVLGRMRAEARDSQNAYMLKHFGSAAAFCFRTLMAIAALKPRRDESRVGWGR